MLHLYPVIGQSESWSGPEGREISNFEFSIPYPNLGRDEGSQFDVAAGPGVGLMPVGCGCSRDCVCPYVLSSGVSLPFLTLTYACLD